MKQTQLDDFEIKARPVKSFFVEMLTRDIELEDAILDLLDNCVDGILRHNKKTGMKPYVGYKAVIEIKPGYFSINDNCGGIPRKLLEHAFMMGPVEGKEKVVKGSVGVYGIGMKRAIFKLGKQALVVTKNNKQQYEIEISKKWIEEEDFKNLNVKQSKISSDDEGTKITVRKLHEAINKQFTDGLQEFTSKLSSKISTNFAYIIEKGFEVRVNRDKIVPRTTKLKFFNIGDDVANIRPYVFETNIDGVDVFLTVGLTRSFLSDSEIEKEKESAGSSLTDAGWTVICNDRVVLEQNRDKLTGWGENNVPQYHNQFRMIAGIVEFRSDDPEKLPTTTTKRGINPDHPLYVAVKMKMCEGTKIFTDFTNDWKKSGEDIDNRIDNTPKLSLNQIKKESHSLHLLQPVTEVSVKGYEFIPTLPEPVKHGSTKQRISFSKEESEIRVVAEYFKLKKWKARDVGERCFDRVYKDAIQ